MKKHKYADDPRWKRVKKLVKQAKYPDAVLVIRSMERDHAQELNLEHSKDLFGKKQSL